MYSSQLLGRPYANGSLHLGHAAGILGADILARFHRLAGNNVLFVSGSDCYGTPIQITAQQSGTSDQEVVNRYHEEFVDTLTIGLGFSYDLFTQTTNETHQRVAQQLFLTLLDKGFLDRRTESQPYCHTVKDSFPIDTLWVVAHTVEPPAQGDISVMTVENHLALTS